MSKRPFELAEKFSDFVHANVFAAELSIQGFDTKVTQKGSVYNVWKRTKGE